MNHVTGGSHRCRPRSEPKSARTRRLPHGRSRAGRISFPGVGALRYGSALTRYRAEAACLRLVADLRLAQTMARSTSSRRTVRFDTTRAVYQILTDAEVAASKPGIEVSLAADPYRAQMRVDGLPGKALSFDGRGEGNQGAVVVLTVGAAEKAVILEPNFGRAYVAGSNN